MDNARYRQVFKYPLHTPVTVVDVPRGGRVLTVQTQDFVPCVWIEVDAAEPAEQRTFVGHGTGHLIPPDEVYLGTAHDVEGQRLVIHVYERPLPKANYQHPEEGA